MQNGVVIVQGDKIVDLGSNLPIPSDAKVIDLGDATLSPGFMDAHTHLTLDFSGNYNERRLKELDQNVSEHAIKATTWARDTVERLCVDRAGKLMEFCDRDGGREVYLAPREHPIGVVLAAGILAGASVLGAQLGARYGRRLPSGILRALIVVVAVFAIVRLLTE